MIDTLAYQDTELIDVRKKFCDIGPWVGGVAVAVVAVAAILVWTLTFTWAIFILESES